MTLICGTPYPRQDALERVLDIATQASAIVLEVYKGEFDVEFKGKNDPVTVADARANAHIVAALAAAFPGVPIVAEESDPALFAGFETKESAFFVDPLDGTREFVERNGQFAVMIGLAEEGRATLGVVVRSAVGRTFAGAEGLGAFEITGGSRRPIRVSAETDLSRARLVVSRSHRSPEVTAAIARFGAASIANVGSAGVKAACVACGEAELYVHAGRAGKRWDTCAPEAIVRAAGGEVTNARGERFDYRSADLSNDHGVLMSNGALHARALERLLAG